MSPVRVVCQVACLVAAAWAGYNIWGRDGAILIAAMLLYHDATSSPTLQDD